MSFDKTRPEGHVRPLVRLAKAPRPVQGSTGGFSKALALGLALVGMQAAFATPTPVGTVIPNTASLAYQIGANPVQTQVTNTVQTTVAAFNTSSSAELLSYAPSLAGATPVLVGPTSCSVGGGSTFTALPSPVAPGGGSLNVGNPQPLAAAGVYHAGDPVFVMISDADQNRDPTVRDTVDVTLTVAATGDTETLRLSETGVNTGVFAGYIQTTSAPAKTNDCLLSVADNSEIVVSYTDPSDPADKSSAQAAVDPIEFVLDSVSGQHVSGTKITLVNAVTGQPAKVLGYDGVSNYPSTVVSGQSATDSSGRQYSFPAGGFQFPLVPAGNYRLQVEPPAGYVAPSAVGTAAIQKLPGAPYLIGPGSYEKDFSFAQTMPMELDIPLDASANTLFVQKTASTETAAVGDFLQFTVNVGNSNAAAAVANVVLVDTLPQGMVYAKGSAELNGKRIADPAVSADGLQLTFPVGSLNAGGSGIVSYVVQVTPAVQTGLVVNKAQGFVNGRASSNVGTAQVMIQDDLFNAVNTLVGRVIVDDCKSVTEAPGLENVRIFMENGSYAVSDKDGRFHFQGVSTGTHVVQLDTATLPKGYEVGDCVHNTRFAGRDYSQFVELHGGALWRVDFHVHKVAPPSGDLSLQLFQTTSGVEQQNSVDLGVSGVPVKNLRVMVIPPDQLAYVPGTAMLDGSAIPDPDNTGGALVFHLGDAGKDWRGVVSFKTSAQGKVEAGALTKAVATFNTPSTSDQRTGVVSVAMPAEAVGRSHEVLTILGFQPGKATLTERDLKTMAYLGTLLKDGKNITIDVVGFTDSNPLGHSDKFKSNMELSKARAQMVADYISKHFNLKGIEFNVEGHGEANPCASNDTEEGRAKNRRTEIDVGYDAAKIDGMKVRETKAHSEAVTAGTKGSDLADADPDAADALLAPQPERKDDAQIDKKWFASDDSSAAWVLPMEGYLPNSPAIKVAVRHAPNQHVKLNVNGEPVDPANFLGTQFNTTQTLGISQWLGVTVREGDNLLEADVLDGDRVIAHLTKTVHYAGMPVRAEVVQEKSVLVADGKTKPVLAIKLYDRWGFPVRTGMVGRYTLGAPYQAYESIEQLQRDQLMASTPREPSYVVREDGTAYLILQPTNSTGQVTVDVQLENGQTQQLRAWVQPAARDWILVGIASGTAAFDKIKGHMQTLSGNDPNSDIYQDGRVAFYAKGSIAGSYLLTASYDSAKQSGVTQNGLQQTVDPNAQFMLYGDASVQANDAVSARKLYVKIERNQFYAMFGDYSTGMTVTELSRYDRMFNGVKSEYNGDHVAYTGFAAQNSQSFVKDEIQGDGTSGLYHLSHQQIILDSETIVLETHDRFQPDVVLSTQTLTRYLDYNVDYLAGTVFFKQPVPSRDSSFNPIYIVAQYEVDNNGPQQVSAGGRVAAKFADGKVEVGTTLVDEAAGASQGKNKLAGVDLRVSLIPGTEFRAEVARTDTVATNGNTGLVLNSTAAGTALTSNPTTGTGIGNAYLVEAKTRTATLESDLYLRQEGVGFGLGEQNLAETAMHKFGGDAKYHLSDKWSVVGEAFHEVSLSGGGTQNVADGGMQYSENNNTANFGLRHATQDYSGLSALPGSGTAVQTGQLGSSATGTPVTPGNYDSNQLYLGGSTGLLNNTLTLHGEEDANVGGKGNNPQYPGGTRLGADYKLTKDATVFVNQQFIDGTNQAYSRMTELGMRTTPWDQAQLQTSVASQATEYGPRNFSTMGLTQGYKVNDHLMLSVGMDKVSNISQPNAPTGSTAATPTFNPNGAPSNGSNSEAFTSLFVGAAYHKESWSFTSRLEAMHSDSERHRGAFGGFYKDLSGGNAFSLSLQGYEDRFDTGGISSTVDARFGLAHRPDDSRWTVLNQLDFVYSDQQGLLGAALTTPQESLNQQQTSVSGSNPIGGMASGQTDQRTAKFINNLQVNYLYNDRSQVSLYYGSKYVITTFDSGEYKGYSDLMGVEYRYDIRPNWDAGFIANRMHTYSANVTRRSYGIESGYSFTTNMWVSLGYNFSGFYDQDFTPTHYTAQGVFVRFRFKFDQDTIKDFAEHASPLIP